MTTRSAAIGTIALTVVLSTVLGLAGLFVGDINDRAYDIVTKVLLSFGVIVTGLLIYLRLDTINAKVDVAAVTAADAKTEAASARRESTRAAQIGAEVHHDIRNDVLKKKVREAVEELEDDPVIMARRIELTALGVQKDRHDLRNREARGPIREQLEARGMPRLDSAD